MTLINQDIKNLVSGISQQPPILRYPEQLEEQVNGFSTEASGLQKRPPSLHVAKIMQKMNIGNKPLIHFINRDETEKYMVIFTGSDIEVYDLEGNKKTVNFADDTEQYIYTEKPRYTLKVLTIADYTFIANVNQIVKMQDAPTDNIWNAQGLLVNIKSGQYGRTYKIEVNGETISSYETPDGSDKSHTTQIATDYIVEQLALQLVEKGYEVQKGSSWLYLNKTEVKNEEGEIIQNGPSTIPAQQVDRFKALGMGIKYSFLFSSTTIYPKVSLSSTEITIKGITNGPDGQNHFDIDNALMKEISRCQKDFWKVSTKEIQEIAYQKEGRTVYYDKEYSLVPQYNTTVTSSDVVRTLIKSYNVYDGYNNQAAFGVMRTTQKFSNLPATAPDGFTVKVAGEEGSSTDDYYVRYDEEQQVWVEAVRPGLINSFKNSTLPHVLVREADGTFSFREAEWAERGIGDEDSNPVPSFIDQTINDVFYHRNRLGFLSGENVILTQSGDFFNFWMSSAIEVQDTDAIDLAVSDNSISTLYHAVPFDAELILFSDNAQFTLEATNVLNPKDAYLTPPLTHFGNSLKAKPVNAGRNIYFVAERSQYTTVREYFTAADNTDSKDAQDITSHCPNYIPNGVYKLIPSTIENILLFLTEGDENSIYVYKYLFIDGQRQQAAWSRWDFGAKIYGGVFMDSYLYIVVERNGWLCLEKISFTFNTKDFQEEFYRVLLDRKVLIDVNSASYRSVDDETKIDISTVYGDTYDPAATYSVVMADGTYLQAEKGVVTVPGDYQGTKAVVGINYLFKIVMSTIMVKIDDNGSTIALNEGRLQLRQMWFNYADSGYFKVKVNDYEYINTQRILGTPSATLGEMPFATGTFKFPVQAENTKSVISLESDSPLPLSLVGAGWIGNYVRRSRKY